MKLIIKDEFKNLIPHLQAKELAELEESILNEGVRDKLVTWQGVLIDGHNRYAICQKHGIHFETVEMDFEDETAVKEWILKNQLGRRNLTDIDRIKVAMQLKDSIEARARERQGKRNDLLSNLTESQERSNIVANLPQCEEESTFWSIDQKVKPINTREEIAALAGVSGKTVARYQAVERTAPEPLKEAMNNKVISINKAYELNKSLNADDEAEREAEAQRLLEEEMEEKDRLREEEHKIFRRLINITDGVIKGTLDMSERDIEIFVKRLQSVGGTVEREISSIERAIEKLREFQERLQKHQQFRRIK